MSTTSLPLPFLVPGSPVSLPPSRAQIEPTKTVWRRPDMQQGRALETLGHAIEYLVDSRMFLVGEPHTPTEAEAIQILSRCSRDVFATCAEIVPVHQSFKQWAAGRMRVGSLNSVSPRHLLR
jgi:hypothetical protein